MSSPHMSFRLNHYQLAKALRILVTLEPNQPIASLSQAAKIIIIDWISKHSINVPLSTSQADIEAIKAIEQIPATQIDPYTTIQAIMLQAKLQSNQQPQIKEQAQILQQVQLQQEKRQRELEEERIFNEVKQEYQESQAAQKTQAGQEKLAIQKAEQKELIDKQIQDQIRSTFKPTKPRIKPSEFHDPNITESTISTVTDFSPPKEWIENITKS